MEINYLNDMAVDSDGHRNNIVITMCRIELIIIINDNSNNFIISPIIIIYHILSNIEWQFDLQQITVIRC